MKFNLLNCNFYFIKTLFTVTFAQLNASLLNNESFLTPKFVNDLLLLMFYYLLHTLFSLF